MIMNVIQTEKLTGDKLLAHLGEGYHNAQDTIKAIDTKTNILTALCVFGFTIVLGISKAMLNYICTNQKIVDQAIASFAISSLWPVFTLCALLLASLIIGTFCFLACMSTLTARAPNGDKHFLPTTILFPYLPVLRRFASPAIKKEVENGKAYYDRIRTAQITESDILNEYHHQITNVAHILGQKIMWNKRSVILFRWQVLTIPAIIVFVAISILTLHQWL